MEFKRFDLHQSKKSSREIAKITKIGVTVQRTTKTWKDSGESSSSRKKFGRKKKILNECDKIT